MQDIQFGHTDKVWDTSYRNLSYVKQGVTEHEITQWESLGYADKHLKSYTGSMCDSSNILPEWLSQIDNIFGLYKQTYTFYRMDTLEIMPVHTDHYRTYCRLNDCAPNQVHRAVLMLEDWKPGHYFELNGVGYVNWKAGDWFMWKGDIPHAASNIGSEPRYTLQITGLPVLSGQLDKLLCFNVPNVNEVYDHPFAIQDIGPKISDKRSMAYMGNRHIVELQTITHDSEAKDILNSEGLHIYLYEPMCSYDVDSPSHTQGFYSEFAANITADRLRAEELDSIYKYAVRNELNNITVHTGDYDVDKWYTFYSDRLNLICDDLFLRTQKPIIGHEITKNFSKKFINLNWRFTKHRQLVSTYLAGKDGYLGWHYKASYDVVKKDLFFDLDNWEHTHSKHLDSLKNGCEIVQQHGPFCVDKISTEAIIVHDPLHVEMWPSIPEYDPGVTPALYNRIDKGLNDYYNNIFVDIINETRFAQPTSNFSEKVFQAVQYKKPFVLVAPPKTLEYVKSLGFKTFSDFWDESYDNEYDPGERLAKLFDVIDYILSLSIDELREMHDKMIPILEHNNNIFKEFIK